MIISHAHKFIFIHIPKCGGTSITKALMPFLGKEDIVLGVTNPTIFSLFKTLPKYIAKKHFEKNEINQGLKLYTRSILNQKEKNGIVIQKHSQAKEVLKYVEPQIWKKYFTFSFVRNPWDRIVSLYYWYHKSKWTDSEGLATKIRSLKNFDGFIESEFLQQASCSEYIFNSGEMILDFIGKLENIDDDFKLICSRIGLPEIQIQKENVTQRIRDYREYYNEETRKIIAEKYEDDIKNFNYSFN